jgi:hypothetical protein
MHGLKVSLSYKGISKIYSNCYQHHKRDMDCKSQDYVAQFKVDNPGIKYTMIDPCIEEKTYLVLKEEVSRCENGRVKMNSDNEQFDDVTNCDNEINQIDIDDDDFSDQLG